MASHWMGFIALNSAVRRVTALCVTAAVAVYSSAPAQGAAARNAVTVADSFLSVGDARLMPSGGLVVVSGRPASITFYSATGRRTATVSPQSVPAWRGQVEIVAAGKDEVTLFDGGDGHMIKLRSTGEVISSTPASREAAEGGRLSMLNRTVARSASLAGACARRVVSGLPSVEAPNLRFATEDASGRIWVVSTGSPKAAVYASDGKLLGSPELPAGADVLDAHETRVLIGERVRQHYRLRMVSVSIPVVGVSKTPCTEPKASAISRTAELALKSTLRSAMMEADGVKAKTDSFPGTMSPPRAGTTLKVLRHGSTGWVAASLETTSTAFCVVALGYLTPVGWVDGAISCGP
jgi:hypothetical protein